MFKFECFDRSFYNLRVKVMSNDYTFFDKNFFIWARCFIYTYFFVSSYLNDIGLAKDRKQQVA